MASDVLIPHAEDHMLSVNFVLVGTVAVLLVLYLLRRRTRIITSQVSVSGDDSESASAQQPT